MNTENIFDVLIIGYGPSGATLANLLGQAGHSVAVAEIHKDVFDKPRAINLDQEALRLWQKIDLAEKISNGCAPHPGTDFVGVDGKLIKAIYSAPPPHPLGWPANVMFVQPEAERHLRERVDTLETVSVFLEHTAHTFVNHADHVAVTFETPEGDKTLRARYLVGCDGANSPTREWLGSSQTDLGFSEHWVVVDAWITRDTPLPPRTTQYCRPDAPTSYVICSGSLRRWELKILADEDPSNYLEQDMINARLAPFVDVDALKFWRAAVYLFQARVSDCWHKGRVFLAGDAAHTMPPFLGQGLNAGLRDVGNLWWKLSRALKGDSGFLESYQTERRPHIMAVTEITKDLGLIVGETDPIKAVARDVRLRAEMQNSDAVIVRQKLIPPLVSGFLDALDRSGLAGTLSPQPTVEKEGVTFLLDDLLCGFCMVEVVEDGLLSVTKDIENPVQFLCKEQDRQVMEFCSEHGITAYVQRPDGTIWGADENAVRLRSRFAAALASNNV